jgi:hypothetical protein
MTLSSRSRVGRHAAAQKSSGWRQTRRGLAALAAAAAFALAVMPALAPPPLPAPAAVAAVREAAYVSAHPQAFGVPNSIGAVDVARGTYTATGAIEALAATGTNYDWASLVLASGGWPTSSSNITVIVRWMRQENGPPNWWNRDNPLNNGYGSGGGGGTGHYANLVVAAQMAAANLHHNPGFAAIAAAFAASAPTGVIERAIWASPWSTSHYANGTHWSQAPVPVVKAPPSAW